MTKQLEPVSVCVVTFNSGQIMRDCLLPFEGRSDDVTIRVWDNGSDDGITPQLLSRLHKLGLIDELHLSPEDPGFAAGANQLIKRSPGQGVLLLNPDARVSVETLTSLRRAAAEDPSIGIVSPVVHGDSDVQVMSAGKQPRLWPLFTHYSGLSKALPGVDFLRGRHLFLDRHGHADHDVEWTSGACMFIPRATLDKVGLLTERWFMYGEDLEYCQRVLDAGLKVRVLASAHAYHAVGASTLGATDELMEQARKEEVIYTEPRAGDATEPPDITGMWGRNTYDYYVQRFKPNLAQRLAWRVIFSGGLAGRAVVRLRRDRTDRLAKKMLQNASAVW